MRHEIRLEDLDTWLREERWETYASSSGKRLEVNERRSVYRVRVQGVVKYEGASSAIAVAAYNAAE